MKATGKRFVTNSALLQRKGEQATESEYPIGEAQIWNPSSHSSGKVFTCEDIPDGGNRYKR